MELLQTRKLLVPEVKMHIIKNGVWPQRVKNGPVSEINEITEEGSLTSVDHKMITSRIIIVLV